MQAHEEKFDRIVACLFDDENTALYARMVALRPAGAKAV
jgi:hypothetical protein